MCTIDMFELKYRKVTKLAKEAEEKYKLDREVKKGKEGKEEEKRGKGNYRGCWYNVSLKVNREIVLTDLEFFGPAEEDAVKYRVYSWIIREIPVTSWWDWWTCFFSAPGPRFRVEELCSPSSKDVMAFKGKNIVVPLPHPVRILPNEWVNIKFELDGPETECMKICKVLSENRLEDGSTILFDLSWGSAQLSSIHFVMGENASEVKNTYDF